PFSPEHVIVSVAARLLELGQSDPEGDIDDLPLHIGTVIGLYRRIHHRLLVFVPLHAGPREKPVHDRARLRELHVFDVPGHAEGADKGRSGKGLVPARIALRAGEPVILRLDPPGPRDRMASAQLGRRLGNTILARHYASLLRMLTTVRSGDTEAMATPFLNWSCRSGSTTSPRSWRTFSMLLSRKLAAMM